MENQYKYDIFLICPVRNASVFQKKEIDAYIKKQSEDGKTVYYPATDTDQDDTVGFRICTDNKKAMLDSKAVAIYWDKNSAGSLFDLGMAFASGKFITIVNIEEMINTEGKSFANMIRQWSYTRP